MSLSENVNFRPKLSNEVQIKFFKKDERGEFYILGVAGKKDYLKIHEVGKEIVELLDGNMTIGEIKEHLKKREIETDVKKFIELLIKKGFIENAPSADKKHQRTNTFLIHYIPLLKKTEHILGKFHSILRNFFHFKLLLLLIMINLAISSVFLLYVALGVIDIKEIFFINDSPGSAITIYLFVIMPLLIATHEFSHALVCFHYGGQPQEMGIGLFVFMPFFYAETTDTWILNKRQSILVFLAGPFSTFFIGNLCFLLSLVSPSPYDDLLRMVAFGAYFLVLLGFNPLLESDGYFILQTLVDFPNLISHARRYVPLWFKEKFGWLSNEEKEQLESYSRQERKILSFYAPLAFMMTVALIAVMGYWVFLFISHYSRLLWFVKEKYPHITFTHWMELAWDTFYIVVILIFLTSLLRKYGALRIKAGF
jgi:hypothetical protein